MDEQQKPPPQPEPVHQPGTGKGEEKPKDEGKNSGRQESGTTGEANRPAGTSTPKDSTGVNPKGPVDPESPQMPPP